MNLLFALSQIEVTGAETYALTLASALNQRDHRITFISDTLRHFAPHQFIPVPIHAGNHRYFSRFQNVLTLRKILRENNIHLIHSHSRAANLVSTFAKGKLPMVVSVHGRWRNHFAFRALPCLGEKTIAVCPYLQRYLTDEIGIAPKRIRMIPNGIDTTLFSPSATVNAAPPRLLFVGRFSGQKGNAIRFLIQKIFPEILREVPELEIEIASSAPSPKDTALIHRFNEIANRSAIKVLESVLDMPNCYRNATVVLGSGRVAMEAMACAKPIVTIGESSAPGLLTETKFDAAFDSNFGDCGPWNLFQNDNHLASDITNVLKNSQLQKELSIFGRQKALSFFDATKVAAQVEQIYRSLV